MKTRLATIAALSIAAVVGTANMAQAGPGDFQYNPGPTTTTTAKPKGPDKVAPKPTTTTTQPPKGPGDIAQPQPDEDPKPPKGPGDIAQPQPGPVDPKPADPMPEPNFPDTDQGSNQGSNGGGSDSSDESLVNGKSVETVPVAQTDESDDSTTEAAAKADTDGGVSPFLMLAIAAAVAGLIALGFAARRRGDEEDAEQF